MDFDNRPVGVFDSGLGGLTVLKEIKKQLPNENVIYFGDNGRTPYGTKSKETVVRYTLQDINFLLSKNVKMIVIACNTASACSMEVVKDKLKIPVLEVVEPGAMAAVKNTKNNRVGIIGTQATVSSKIYEKAINRLNASINTFSKACPLFVNIAEEGWWDNQISYLIAKEYLDKMTENDIDTLVLGCTHYPLLEKVIKRVVGENVNLVSSAFELAKVLKQKLKETGLESNQQNPYYRYYTSDSVSKFVSLGSKILGERIEEVDKINIEKY